MLHFIVATYSEAQPLINFFNLKKNTKVMEVQLFFNNKMTLTITGIGDFSSSIGLCQTFFECNKSKNDIWINFGLAGHSSFELGKLVLANKISHISKATSFYPFIPAITEVQQEGCMTYHKANHEYDEKLSDMEAYGFYNSAIRYSSKELIYVLKIISDNAKESINFKNKKEINELIIKSEDEIKLFVKQIIEIRKEFYSDSDRFNTQSEKILNSVKFTFTEKKIIKDLLLLYFSKNMELKPNLIDNKLDFKSNFIKLKKYIKS